MPSKAEQRTQPKTQSTTNFASNRVRQLMPIWTEWVTGLNFQTCHLQAEIHFVLRLGNAAVYQQMFVVLMKSFARFVS